MRTATRPRTPSSRRRATRERMPVEVIMPMLGMAQETGKVLRWLQAEDEAVAKVIAYVLRDGEQVPRGQVLHRAPATAEVDPGPMQRTMQDLTPKRTLASPK